MKSYKIDVSASPYLSEAIQKHAFDLGWKWMDGIGKPRHQDMPFLFLEKNGFFAFHGLKTGFDADKNTLISPIDFLKLKKEDVAECGTNENVSTEVSEEIKKLSERLDKVTEFLKHLANVTITHNSDVSFGYVEALVSIATAKKFLEETE